MVKFEGKMSDAFLKIEFCNAKKQEKTNGPILGKRPGHVFMDKHDVSYRLKGICPNYIKPSSPAHFRKLYQNIN